MADKKCVFLMVQGTMSSAGKSLLTAGLCRVFKQDGYKVAPFKSQNMALNSYITEDGLEMGRAQVMQAEAAGVAPSVYMNPILLKPTDDVGSQVIVNGKILGNMRAREYFAYKKKLIPDIMHAVEKLSEEYDIIVIEGAGSPAEINLKENDIVNMGMAKLVDAPVLLVGDIDRGGVFAQLYGTIALLEPEEKARIKGLVINKFRGDKTILDPGIEMIEKLGGVPVAGVLPYMDIKLDDEDSLTERFERHKSGLIDIAVIRLPHISNFTDFNVFDEYPRAGVRYVKNVRELGKPDLCILPGSKSTISDLEWLRQRGLDAAIKKYAAAGGALIGICGGYQMLGESIKDTVGAEGGGEAAGLSLLPVSTVMESDKIRSRVQGSFQQPEGIFACLKGMAYEGYEIHMGKTECEEGTAEFTGDGSGCCSGNIYGTYIHGIFDAEGVAAALLGALAEKKGITAGFEETESYESFKQRQYDMLADTIRQYMDMDYIKKIMGLEKQDAKTEQGKAF